MIINNYLLNYWFGYNTELLIFLPLIPQKFQEDFLEWVRNPNGKDFSTLEK